MRKFKMLLRGRLAIGLGLGLAFVLGAAIAGTGTITVLDSTGATKTYAVTTNGGGSYLGDFTLWDSVAGANGLAINASHEAAVSAADGSVVVLGAKADAKSAATDTTSITIQQVLKEISFMEQNPASRAVTNAGTFAVQGLVSVTTTDKGGTITSGGVAQNAIASNGSRKGWCIQNDPAATEALYVRLNGTASATTGVSVAAGVQACNAANQIDTTAVSVFAATTAHRWYGYEVQ